MLPIHAADSSRTIYVVMGVSGSGKTIIGSALARTLDIDFVEGDDYHPVENVQRMSQAIPLTDDDRIMWLRANGDRCHRTVEARGAVGDRRDEFR